MKVEEVCKIEQAIAMLEQKAEDEVSKDWVGRGGRDGHKTGVIR